MAKEKTREERIQDKEFAFHPILGKREFNGVEYDRLMAETSAAAGGNGGWVKFVASKHDKLIKILNNGADDSGNNTNTERREPGE